MSVYLNENKYTVVLNDIGLNFLKDPEAFSFQEYIKELSEKGFFHESVIIYIVTDKSPDKLPDYLKTKIKDTIKCYVIEVPSCSEPKTSEVS